MDKNQYTTVEKHGRHFDALYIHSGEVIERTTYPTLAKAERQARCLEFTGVPYVCQIIPSISDLLENLCNEALAAGNDSGRVERASALVESGHVFDAGSAGQWIVFSEKVDLLTTPATQLWDWAPGVGKPPPAERYSVAPQPVDGQAACTCADALYHIGKCKHQIAAIMALKVRIRLADDTLYSIPAKGDHHANAKHASRGIF